MCDPKPEAHLNHQLWMKNGGLSERKCSLWPSLIAAGQLRMPTTGIAAAVVCVCEVPSCSRRRCERDLWGNIHPDLLRIKQKKHLPLITVSSSDGVNPKISVRME